MLSFDWEILTSLNLTQIDIELVICSDDVLNYIILGGIFKVLPTPFANVKIEMPSIQCSSYNNINNYNLNNKHDLNLN